MRRRHDGSGEHGISVCPAPMMTIIFADIVKSLGRDLGDVQAGAGDARCQLGGGAFADLDASRRYAVADAFRARGGTEVAALSPRDPAMLLPRRSGGAFAGAGAAATVPEGAYAGAGRLVAARSGAGAAEAVARCTLMRVRVARLVDAAGVGVRYVFPDHHAGRAQLRGADQAELRQCCYAIVKTDFRNDPAVLELEDGRSGEPHLAARRCWE